jgi:hypothetical protein
VPRGRHERPTPRVAVRERRDRGRRPLVGAVPSDQAPAFSRRPAQTLWIGPGHRLVHYPVSAGRFVNLVAFAPARPEAVESWSATATVEEFLAEFEGWAIEDAAMLAGCLAGRRDDPVAALQRYEALRRPRTSRIQELSHGRSLVNHLPDGPEQEQRETSFASADPLVANGWIYGYDPEAELGGTAALPEDFFEGQPVYASARKVRPASDSTTVRSSPGWRSRLERISQLTHSRGGVQTPPWTLGWASAADARQEGAIRAGCRPGRSRRGYQRGRGT